MIVIIGMLLFSACQKEGSSREGAADLKPMPVFKLPYLDGTVFDSKSLEGKVVFIDFWRHGAGHVYTRYRV